MPLATLRKMWIVSVPPRHVSKPHRFEKGRAPRRLLRILLALVALGFVAACSHKSDQELTFALPAADWWTAAPFANSRSTQLFKEAGVKVKFLEVNSGLASKNAVVAGTADVGVSAATPLALAAARKEKLVVLGTYLQSRAVVGLARPREIATEGLVEPVAIVPSTISESFLFKYLAARGESQKLENNELKKLSLRPADIPSALKNGSARSAVVWEPFLTLATQDGRFVVERNVPEFEVNLYILTRPSLLHSDGRDVRAFLKAVEACCHHVRKNPEEVRQEIEHRFGFTNNFLTPTWGTVDYNLTNDHEKMRAEILREAAVSKALGYIKEIPSIDYLFMQQ